MNLSWGTDSQQLQQLILVVDNILQSLLLLWSLGTLWILFKWGHPDVWLALCRLRQTRREPLTARGVRVGGIWGDDCRFDCPTWLVWWSKILPRFSQQVSSHLHTIESHLTLRWLKMYNRSLFLLFVTAIRLFLCVLWCARRFYLGGLF